MDAVVGGEETNGSKSKVSRPLGVSFGKGREGIDIVVYGEEANASRSRVFYEGFKLVRCIPVLHEPFTRAFVSSRYMGTTARFGSYQARGPSKNYRVN